MGEKRAYKFGLRKKLVLFTTILAVITYTTSAIFIDVLFPMIQDFIGMKKAGFSFITYLMGIIWSGILAFLAAGFIIKPLQKLERVTLKAAHGDIGEDVEISKSDDEIRSLGVAFNHMLFNLRDMVQTIDENFKQTNEKVIAISRESAIASEKADMIDRTVNEISLGAENSAAATQNTASSMDEVTHIAEEVQLTAQQSQKISNEMVEELDESKKVIFSLVSGIQTLAEDNKQSLVSVKKLEENAAQVEQIIQLVGDIAAQTNLLALNASIEAARAGEHGKGFAVVADEVRKLADESAKAVQGISELIQNIQSEVRNVVSQITNQVQTALGQAEKGHATNQAIEEMTRTVVQMASAVEKISTLVDRQMEDIQHTATQSQEVAAIAEETSAGAIEVATAVGQQTEVIEKVERLAHELNDQAVKLKGTITRFKM
ncbi:methyl-accepting chemotaxis protein [Robertmurraya beringensis]|uniref:Methyl-accepting chemotaxis protein n=1 Tax=Robertmurraya beringensis TaxID=641660 RepID=A0ABV6KR97_9BACI